MADYLFSLGLIPVQERGFQGLADVDFEEALRELYGIPNRASGICRAADEEAVG